MNQLRQPFSELSPEVYKGLVQASIALEKSELGNALVELVYLRVSQINGCAFCLEKHSQALRKGGMAQSKLDALAGWRVAPTLLRPNARRWLGPSRSPTLPPAMRKMRLTSRCANILPRVR